MAGDGSQVAAQRAFRKWQELPPADRSRPRALVGAAPVKPEPQMPG